MRLDVVYRLLNHLALGLACACLIEAERPFLPGLVFCLAPFLGLVAVAFLAEGRWVLPVWGANVLGALIAAGAVGWVVVQTQEDNWTQHVPLAVAVVPHLGPLLMALMLVKLFRRPGPAGQGEFWLLQGLGLLQVGLGCVLASGAAFGALLVAYLAAALACLALHYLQREQAAAGRAAAPVRAVRAAAGPAGEGRLPFAGLLVPFAGRWTLLVAGLALGLFLLTPRADGPGWDPFQRFGPDPASATPAQTGFSEEINLNRTGSLEVNVEVAFTVAVTDAQGQPRQDLPGDQRWRGVVLDRYEEGLWTPTRRLPVGGLSRRQERLPDLGPDQFFLTFVVQPRQAGGLFLADPVLFGPDPSPLPVVQLDRRGPREPTLFFEYSGTVVPLLFALKKEHRYRQVVAPTPAPGRCPAVRWEDNYLDGLVRRPSADLEEWTDRLLRRLAADPRYRLDLGPPPAPGQDAEVGPALVPARWEPVAVALTDYLAHSGEYGYSLESRRQDKALDPVLDFLTNVKQGHCERYATALALMLRALGIPARVIKGFRGAEGQGDGIYVVRHSHAHAWVEALVPRPGGGPGEYDWLTLDPTPGGDGPAGPSFSLARWWEDSRTRGQQFWRDLIVDYNANQQADLWEGLKPGRRGRLLLKRLGVALTAAVGLAALALGGSWLRRRRAGAGRAGAAPAPAVAVYARLLALLARRAALAPRPAQTPREFAAAAREALRGVPAAAALAGVPDRVVDLLYRVRFGGRPLDEAEAGALEARLDELEAALRDRG
jgi:transglutaminase-like putative cysteine protease